MRHPRAETLMPLVECWQNSNFTENLCMSLLSASLIKIRSKMNRYPLDNIFPIIFLWETKEQVTHMLIVRSAPKSKSSRVMAVLITCKSNKHSIKSKSFILKSILLSLWGPHGRVNLKPMVKSQIKLNFTEIFTFFFVIRKFDEELIEMKSLSSGKHFSSYISMRN